MTILVPLAAADPVVVPIDVPGAGDSIATPSSVTVPPFIIGPVATPFIPSVPVGVPATAQVCIPPGSPNPIICFGPVPGIHLLDTPSVGSIQLLPAIPPTTIAVPFTAAVDFDVAPTTGSATVDPAGSRSIPPTTIDVITPFGTIPIPICPNTCPAPDPTSGGVATNVTITVTIQGTPFTVDRAVTVPLP